jgi:hypothetical protein
MSVYRYHIDSAEQQYRAIFQRASALLGLNSGISELDKLVGFIQKGSIVFIKGSRSRKHILELLCLRSIIQYQNYCIFVDGGNGFDPYLLSELTTSSKESPKEVLSRIMISRAFTCHQLASLVKETVNIAKTFPSNLIAVSDMLYLFTDRESEVDDYEIEMILPTMLECMKNMAGDGTIVAVTSDANNRWLDRMIESFSNIVLAINDDKEIIHVTLEKHPLQHKGSAELKLKYELPTTKPMTIEPWL